MNEEQIKKLIQEEVVKQISNLTDVVSPDTIYIDRKTKVFDGRRFQFGTQEGLKMGTDTAEKVYFISEVHMAELPTSSAGLETGQLWNNGGVVNIA